MTNNMRKPHFVILKNGPRRFYWQMVGSNGIVIARGPGRAKYLQSVVRCREQIATIKNGCSKWEIIAHVSVQVQ